jgi:hypothetical protein
LFLGDSLQDSVVIIICFIEIDIEFSEVSLKVFTLWLADGFGLFDKVISHLFAALGVVSIGLLIESVLVLFLVENSFSHVLVLFKTSHFFNKSLDNLNQSLVSSLLLLVCLFLTTRELIFVFEQFQDVLFSALLQILVNIRFELFWVTVVIGLGEDSSANFLSN